MIKWAAINGTWSPERLEKAKEKLKLIQKSNKFMMKRDRVTNEIRRLETSERKQRNFFDHMKGFQKKQTSEGPIRNKNGDLQSEDADMTNTFNENLGDQLLPGEKTKHRLDQDSSEMDQRTPGLGRGTIPPCLFRP